MKRLLAFTLILTSLASAMQQNSNIQPAQQQATKLYNAPSLRFLAALNLGRRNPEAKELEKLPQELRVYAQFMQSNNQPTKDAQITLMNACRAQILDEKLLEDLKSINPHLDL